MNSVVTIMRPELPAAKDCVLPYLLRRFADDRPDDVLVVFEDGSSWTCAKSFAVAQQFGAGFRSAGLATGDRVLVWMPNAQRTLAAFFGAGMVGVSFVAINTAYKGNLLRHVVANSGGRVMVAHPDLVARLTEIDLPATLTTVFTDMVRVGALAPALAERGVNLRSWEELEVYPGEDLPVDGIHPWTEQSICYTSGTTGPSKGVLSSYMHLYTMGVECTRGITTEDRYLVHLPLFHVGGTLFAYGAIARGASIALMTNFQTDTFLHEVKNLGATGCILIGAMAGFLMSQPPGPADRDHFLRLVMVLPLNEDSQALKTRFGFDVITVFNMSEISCPIRSELNPNARGSCGRLRSGVEARIVDDNDCAVQVGAVGELVLRTELPWTMSHGYNEMPEATARAWRNGWFHTGDGFRLDAEGNYFFVDRMKDAIRRRGENISSFEVEAEVLAYPSVLEAAVVGVPNNIAEEDVLAIVVAKPGRQIVCEELVVFLMQRLPHFMVPRYVRVIEELPKTPTSKIEKHVLRREGVTSTTWDREVVGIRPKRQILDS